MRNDELRAHILGVRVISNVSDDLVRALSLGQRHKSLGIVTADTDDVLYTALDEATKDADVDVVYAKSMYAGSANASTKLAGEVIGIIGGPSPAEVRSGLESIRNFMENGSCFVSANEDDSIVYYAHTVSRTGSYLSKSTGIREGQALAYLIAPPLEAIYGLDAALKAADVRMVSFYGPPSETNFGGGLLTGTQSACKSACAAFAQAVKAVADSPSQFE
ncbi:ethanolamine utilization microcompartment protein EutL [Lactonifactor longoviformis]|uniref:ethanolamine utilization microcompartment protein EutL n=1 Tax=Lactonifactor TaxID=420345 RepID=UPI0012B06D6D|nr:MULTISPECIES: ethanolamine utilization microcompartment protein EutL [Lactonifactor]MCB5714806.1 ethanolamine utilization microcompartment protein EutL [Lactonifactor longoviformis]MCB5718760.1 ethanolamine utilization microcompartment protein EutL [Lactonifactor longoviformis]MCQ4672208.1 ethanolamine utilization microcompartment protein EutL [Lactonifactor longoviformis]MSA03552.1 ethanolamine utilization microcompartment protein EutL [Lactonifactor sp. BIOML-A5]MSA07248.1 ethanolamine ut